MANDEDLSSDWSGSMVDDSDNLDSYILSESRRPFHATKEECEMTKKKLISELRIGSALDIGEKSPICSQSDSVPGRKNSCKIQPLKYSIVGHPVYFSPISLLVAREQGICGPSPRYYRLRDFYASRFFTNETCGKCPRWPSNQSFQQHIQGNLWSVSSFGLSAVYQHHSACVNALNFNRSGHLIASGSDDTCVAIANSYTGELKTRFLTGHALNVFQVRFVPNTHDLNLVTSARDGMVRLAELHPDGQTVGTTRTLAIHQEACRNIVFVYDEPAILLTAGEDGSVFSIDLRTNQTDQLLHLPLSPFYSISANPSRSSEFCVSGKYESVVRVFDRRKVSVRSPKDGYLHSFAPHHLLSKSRQQRRDRYDEAMEETNVEADRVDEGCEEDSSDDSEADAYDDRTDSGESDLAEEGFFSSRLGRQLLGLLREDLRRRNRVPSPPELGDESAEARDGQGPRSRNRTVRLSDRVDPLGDHSQTKYSITSTVYSSNGDAILASFNDEDIYLFDSKDDTLPPLHVYRGHRNNDTVKGVNFYGPNSEFVVSGSDDGFIYIWDRHSEGIVQWLCGDIAGAVNVLEPHPFYPVLATSGCDCNVKIWTPMSRRGNIGHPEAWLKVIKDREPNQRPLFDPEQIVDSMRSLRHSSLAKHFFGENEDFLPSDDDLPSSWDDSDDARNGVDMGTVIQGKRKAPEFEEEVTSGSTKSSKRSKKSQDLPHGSSKRKHLCLTAAPQGRLPFNSKDLQLRVAANWARRNRDSQTVTFAFGLPDVLRPMLRVNYDATSHRMTDFLRRSLSARTSDDSSDDEEDDDRGRLGQAVEPDLDQTHEDNEVEDTTSSTFSSSSIAGSNNSPVTSDFDSASIA